MKAITKNYSAKLVALLVTFAFIVVVSLVGCAQKSTEEPEANVNAVEQVEEAEPETEAVDETAEVADEPATKASDNTSAKSATTSKNTDNTTQSAPKSTGGPSATSATAAPKADPAAPAHTHNWVPVYKEIGSYVCCDGASFHDMSAASAHESALERSSGTNHSNSHVSFKSQQTINGYTCSCGATK